VGDGWQAPQLVLNIMVTQEELEEKCNEFELKEPRGGFYDLSTELMKKDCEVQGMLLLLASWNNSYFRFKVNKFNVQEFKDLIFNLDPLFKKLETKSFPTDYKEIEKEITDIYTPLSEFEGVAYTGASKIMHLKNQKLFIPWDDYIRTEYSLSNDSASYVKFHELMKEKFGHLHGFAGRTLPKTIDEYNYMTISIPELGKKREKAENKD
jgi:hypothetical protein